MTTENINLANKPFGPTNGEYYIDWSCKKTDSLIHEPEVIVKSEDEPCIKFVHPVWVDEITYFDTTVEHYNEFVLKAFLKNYCNDTVKVAMKGLFNGENRIYTGFYSVEFIYGGGGGNIIDDLVDTFYVIPPNDSIFMYVLEERDYFIWMIERYSIGVNFVLNKKYNETQFLKIEKRDFNAP